MRFLLGHRAITSVIARGASARVVRSRTLSVALTSFSLVIAETASLAAPISRRREIKHTFSHERDELRSRRDTCSLLCRVIDFTAGRFYFALCRARNRFTSPAQWPTTNNRTSLRAESRVCTRAHEDAHTDTRDLSI